ncbi:MAG: bifunctional demethylmenaquinone methyltransferase/2-methoxy-6-polyprenyl-1,4-benzoquinol methylase UbiE [Gammaproteobacteria bacterium]
MNDERQTTDFGFERISPDEKTGRVHEVFESVADRYDLMNDLMSFGVHRLWKRLAIDKALLKPGQKALDVAAGTGDLTAALARKAGDDGLVVMSDINPAMLANGRSRMLDDGLAGNTRFVIANAESLPFPERSFDCVTTGFGLRNVTDKDAALRSMFRVLRPGGQLLILEFSKPASKVIGKIYDRYSFSVLPRLGGLVTGDADSYRYLVESIRVHPDQETLKTMMEDAGFERCGYQNISGGIVALHCGYRV